MITMPQTHEKLILMDSLKVLHMDLSLSLCKHQHALRRLLVKFRDEIDGHTMTLLLTAAEVHASALPAKDPTPGNSTRKF